MAISDRGALEEAIKNHKNSGITDGGLAKKLRDTVGGFEDITVQDVGIARRRLGIKFKWDKKKGAKRSPWGKGRRKKIKPITDTNEPVPRVGALAPIPEPNAGSIVSIYDAYDALHRVKQFLDHQCQIFGVPNRQQP